jgi:hypothetical protein
VTRSLTRLLFWLILVGLVSCVTTSQKLITHYTPTLQDAGLGYGVPRLQNLTIAVHPKSDGGTFPSDWEFDTDGGELWRVDDASFACWSYPGERTLWVAHLQSQWVCHGLGHVARSDNYRDAGYYAGKCIGLGDHEYNASVQLDAKCKEVTPCSDCF